MLSGKGTLKASQIVGDSFCREMIHHIPYSTGGGTLYLLECLAHKSGNQAPLPFRSFPVQLALADLVGQVVAGPCLRYNGIGRKLESHQPDEFGIGALFLVRHFYFVLQAFAAFQCIFLHQQAAGSVFDGNLRSAEGPSRARVHVHLHVQACSLALGVAEHLHPFRGEEVYFIRIISLHTIDRGNLQRSHSCLGIGFQIMCQVGGIHRTTHPPPAGGRLCLSSHLGPRKVLRGERQNA